LSIYFTAAVKILKLRVGLSSALIFSYLLLAHKIWLSIVQYAGLEKDSRRWIVDRKRANFVLRFTLSARHFTLA
jgi:hypothetical protein